jgi:hypothetical protein
MGGFWQQNLLIVSIFLLLPNLINALYFYVTDQPRCFIEEVPSETLVVGSYKNPDFIQWGTPNVEFTGVVSRRVGSLRNYNSISLNLTIIILISTLFIFYQ